MHLLMASEILHLYGSGPVPNPVWVFRMEREGEVPYPAGAGVVGGVAHLPLLHRVGMALPGPVLLPGASCQHPYTCSPVELTRQDVDQFWFLKAEQGEPVLVTDGAPELVLVCQL